MILNRSNLIVTARDAFLSLFFDQHDLTLVGYWWYRPPKMQAMSYTVMQLNGNHACHAAAVRYASAHEGSVTDPVKTPRHVTVFTVTLPLPTSTDTTLRDVAFALHGLELYQSMRRAAA